MQIVVRGNGPALVMLHGWAMHGGIFESLCARLERQFTLYLVDLPGHGGSANSAVAFELETIVADLVTRIPPALWLGWSLGGLVALHAAQRHPASVRGLLMVCASPRFVRADDWPQGMDASVFQGFSDALAGDCGGTIDRFLRLQAQGSDRLREELRGLRDQVFAFGTPSTATLDAGLALLQDSDLRAGLPALEMPSLWIAGRRDRLVCARAMQVSAQLAAAGAYLGIERAGHAPFLSHDTEMASAISQFSAALPA